MDKILKYMYKLRLLIREIIRRRRVNETKKNKVDLLTEPDEPIADDDHNEISTVSSIAGVTTPLGTGPSYPSKRKKRKDKPEPAVGDENWYKTKVNI